MTLYFYYGYVRRNKIDTDLILITRMFIVQWSDHRVGSFSPVVGIGTPPNPSPPGECANPPPPPSGSVGRGTLASERGVGSWESPNSDEGKYTVVLYTL